MKNPTRALLSSVVLAACSGDEGSPDPNAGRFALTAFDTCDDLAAYLRRTALDSVTRGSSGYAVATRGVAGPARGAYDSMAASGAAEGAPSAPPAPGPLTGTNNQEAGVDEGDFVKSDNGMIYVLHGATLVILRAFPAADAAVVSQTPLPGYPTELYVSDGKALVLGSEWVADPAAADRPCAVEAGGVAAGVPGGGAPAPLGWCGGRPRVRATVLDVSDATAPAVVRSSLIDGSLVGSRMVDGAVHLVSVFAPPVSIDWNVTVDVPVPEYPACAYGRGETTVTPGMTGGGKPMGGPAAPPSDGGAAPGRAPDAGVPAPAPEPTPAPEPPPIPPMSTIDAACQAALDRYNAALADYERAYLAAVTEAARASIAALALDDLLPKVDTTAGDSTTTTRVSACTSVYRSDRFTGFGLVSVSTIDLRAPADVLDAASVLGDYGQVYASTDNLDLAMAEYTVWDYTGPPPAGTVVAQTAVHQFGIGRRAVTYAGSGQVDGWVQSPFSLDEHGGRLRIATTVDRFASDFSASRDNSFTVLAPADGELAATGAVTGIAPGEQITAARILDDKGWLVTVRQVDPLIAIDLSDPEHPVVAGELTIPGFSQYVHPLGANRLLTVGTSATGGLALSLFDVSNVAAPMLTHSSALDGVSSEAQYDHKAFTFLPTGDAPDVGILALPVSDWTACSTEGGVCGAELVVYDVSPDAGFALRGRVSHADLYTSDEAAYCGWRDVRRAVLSNADVYSISTAGFKVNPLADLTMTLASGTFGATDLCGYAVAEGGAGGGTGVASGGSSSSSGSAPPSR